MNIYNKLGLEELKIDPTKFRDKAKTSISLGMCLEENACAFLCEKFINKENHHYFREQFMQAISGDGNELLKMDAVKSSSLCSLLFFYNLSSDENHKLTINDITYTKSYFEYKNKVYRNPSNMDVVLTNDSGDILFIECKFTEYFNADKAEISSSYFNKNESKKVMEKLLEKNILKALGNNKYSASFNGNPIYATGLKQIVAHYVGVNNFRSKKFYKGNYEDDRDKLPGIINPKVRFMEVLFDFGEGLKDYKEASDYLIEKIIDIPDVYKKPMTYQEILMGNPKYILDNKVKVFYKY